MTAFGLRDGKRRRILALSGGGVRGVVEVAFLEAIEAEYRRRHGPETRLGDVFDLVGGTSTGALIAAGIATGLPMSEIRKFYLDRAKSYFARKSLWKFLRPAYRAEELHEEIRRIVGDIRLDDPKIQTHLAVVTKRLDTGSAWIVSNLPKAPFWDDPPDGSYHGNRNYVLARLLCASTAAPTFFRQQRIDVGAGQVGVFVDGGVSPHNDPSLALLMLARLPVFGLRWPGGPDRLSLVSIGTGHFRSRAEAKALLRSGPLPIAYKALFGLVADGEALVLTLMQALGRSELPAHVNAELGDLSEGGLLDEPLLDYLRLDLPLDTVDLAALGQRHAGITPARLRDMVDPAIIEPLYQLARDHCAKAFDLARLLR